jgi:hypothetical protein
MSNVGHQSTTEDGPQRAWLVWLGLPLLFIGCGLLTVAVVELASNKSISAVTAIIGGPLVVLGMAFLVLHTHRDSA